MKVKVICQCCGKEFETTSYRLKDGRGKYCSKECYKLVKCKKFIQICKYCGIEFEVIKSNYEKEIKKYCSKECYANAQNTRVDVTCAYCNKPFTVKRYRYNPGKHYCSSKCSDIAHTQPKVEKRCIVCGKIFFVSKRISDKGYGKYCSKKCSGKGRTTQVSVTCDFCKKKINVHAHRVKNHEHCFCSMKCMGQYQSKYKTGANSPRWQGGFSFTPYCEKFNNRFKERVREFFNNTCVICGITNVENFKNMDVHHVHYDKDSCCSSAPQEFVTLCRSCHSKTNGNRDYWKSYFHKLIHEKFGGKCYFTKEEWSKIKGWIYITV